MQIGNVEWQEEGSQVGKSIDDVHITHLEVGEVCDSTSISQVRLINEMPVALSAVALAFDVVSEGSALSERVASLVLGQTCMRLF